MARGRERRGRAKRRDEELTGRRRRKSVASGTDGNRRIDGDDLRAPAVKTRTLATKHSPPARFLRLGDVVPDCGAAGHDHGTRGGRWSWLRRAALSGAFGDERKGEQRRRRGPESEGEVRGGRGGAVALVEASRSGGSRRWPRARRPHARRPSGVLLARGGRRWRLWWAGPAPGPWWGAR